LPSDVSGGFPVAMPIRLAGKHRLRLVGKYALVRHCAVESSQVSPAWQSSNTSGAIGFWAPASAGAHES
jgi:hypothetical protein